MESAPRTMSLRLGRRSTITLPEEAKTHSIVITPAIVRGRLCLKISAVEGTKIANEKLASVEAESARVEHA